MNTQSNAVREFPLDSQINEGNPEGGPIGRLGPRWKNRIVTMFFV